MEWKLGEHWFAYFMLILLFIVAGSAILFVLDFFQIKGIVAYLIFFFSITVIFVPIAKCWHNKFIQKR